MSTPRTSVKMAGLGAMPSESVMITTNVNPGDLRSWRRAKRTSFNMEVSFGSKRDDRIDPCGTSGWHAAGDQSHAPQRKYGYDYSSGVNRPHVVKQRHQRAAGSNRTEESNPNADCNQCHALAKHEL